MHRLYQDARSRFALLKSLGIEPHEGQRTVLAAPERFKVVVAWTRFGKSHLGGQWATCWLFEAHPPTRGWIVGPTYEDGEFEFRYLWDWLVSPGELRFKRANYNAKGGDMQLVTDWGSELTVKSAEHPKGLGGEELDYVIMAEAGTTNKRIWERSVYGRLSNRQGEALITGTPRGSDYYIELFNNGQGAKPDWKSWRFPTGANPYFPREEIETAKRNLTPEMYDEQFEGRFAQFSGLVYKEFNREKHVREPLLVRQNGKIVSFKQIIAGVDWGYTNPCAIVVMGIDGDDNVAVLDEWYHTEQSQAQKIAAAKALRDKWEVSHFYCDPESPDDIAAFMRGGLKASQGITEVGRGIEIVRQKLRKEVDGKKGFVMSARCVNGKREFGSHMYAISRTGAKKEDKFTGDQHFLDALRYALTSVDRSRRITVRTSG